MASLECVGGSDGVPRRRSSPLARLDQPLVVTRAPDARPAVDTGAHGGNGRGSSLSGTEAIASPE